MKKLISICLLLMVAFGGSMTIDAKTSHKKSTKTTKITSSSNINSLLNKYEDAVDYLSQWYDPDCNCLEGGWGHYFIEAAGEEETLYKKLKKLEKSMNSTQKSKFKRLSKSIGLH